MSYQVNEGSMDFLRGALGNIGGSVKKSVVGTVAAGKKASAIGDLKGQLEKLINLNSDYDIAVAKVNPQANQPAQQNQQSQQPNPQQTQQTKQSPTAPPTRQEKTVQTKYGPVQQFESFSDYLKAENVEFVTEGVWDFVKGASKHFGQAITTPVKQAYQAGKQQSMNADISRTESAVKEQLKKIAVLVSSMGDEGIEMANQYLDSNAGESADRLKRYLLGTIKKMNTQQQQAPEDLA